MAASCHRPVSQSCSVWTPDARREGRATSRAAALALVSTQVWRDVYESDDEKAESPRTVHTLWSKLNDRADRDRVCSRVMVIMFLMCLAPSLLLSPAVRVSK